MCKKVIECTKDNPWDQSEIPLGHMVEHDEVETTENDCFRRHECKNCGYQWIEEFSW